MGTALRELKAVVEGPALQRILADRNTPAPTEP
jgi:hypothetical protein